MPYACRSYRKTVSSDQWWSRSAVSQICIYSQNNVFTGNDILSCRCGYPNDNGGLMTQLALDNHTDLKGPVFTANVNFWHRSFTFNSNKSPTWYNNFSVYYPDVCLQLNIFRAFSRPSSGAQWLQWQPLVLPSYHGDSRAVFVVGPAGWPAGTTTNTARLSPRYEGKTRGCHCSRWAPDDGRENARNMLSCKQTSG